MSGWAWLGVLTAAGVLIAGASVLVGDWYRARQPAACRLCGGSRAHECLLVAGTSGTWPTRHGVLRDGQAIVWACDHQRHRRAEAATCAKKQLRRAQRGKGTWATWDTDAGRTRMDQRRATRLARAEQQIDRERKERLSIARARRQLRTEGGLAKSGFQVHKRYGNMHWIDWNKLVLDNNGRCYYCGRKRRRLVKEHRIPLARGGTNDESNIVPACTPCNSRKGTLTDTEFIEVLQRAGIRKRGN